MPGASAESKSSDATERLSQKLVWYPAYGSNCLFERFCCYIEGGRFGKLHSVNPGCSDKMLSMVDRLYEFSHNMFFGNQSSNWKSSV